MSLIKIALVQSVCMALLSLSPMPHEPGREHEKSLVGRSFNAICLEAGVADAGVRLNNCEYMQRDAGARFARQESHRAGIGSPVTRNAIALVSEEQKERSERIAIKGIGPARVGMSASQLKAAWPNKIVYDEIEQNCGYFSEPDDRFALRFGIVDGRFVMFQVMDARYKTLSGIAVGDSVAKLKSTYGDKLQLDYDFGDEAQYLFVPSDAEDKAFRVVFFILDGKVSSIKGGLEEFVMLKELCL